MRAKLPFLVTRTAVGHIIVITSCRQKVAWTANRDVGVEKGRGPCRCEELGGHRLALRGSPLPTTLRGAARDDLKLDSKLLKVGLAPGQSRCLAAGLSHRKKCARACGRV